MSQKTSNYASWIKTTPETMPNVYEDIFFWHPCNPIRPIYGFWSGDAWWEMRLEDVGNEKLGGMATCWLALPDSFRAHPFPLAPEPPEKNKHTE
jgi:hypothetical protein